MISSTIGEAYLEFDVLIVYKYFEFQSNRKNSYN